MVIPLLIGAIDLASGLEEMEIGRGAEIIQTKALLQSVINTEKSPGDFRRLAVTQIAVKDYQLIPMVKNLKE